MQNFQQNLQKLEAADTQVLGVSMDSTFSNAAWAEKIGVTFPGVAARQIHRNNSLTNECAWPQSALTELSPGSHRKPYRPQFSPSRFRSASAVYSCSVRARPRQRASQSRHP